MLPLLDCSSQGESSGDDNPHPLNPNEHTPDPNEDILNPKKRAANPIEQKPKEPKRIRLTPTTIPPVTFSNEVARDKEVPEKCCAVCCRLLYPEDYCKLSKPHKKRIEDMFVKDRQTALGDGKSVPEIEKITWPLLNYRDQNGNQIQELHTHIPKTGKNKGEEYVIVCGTHRSSGAQSVETIMEYICFVNKHWMYPGCQPDVLRNLHLRGEGFLSPILVFCELTNSRSKLTQATRAGHHFVSGRIGLYKSKEYLGAYVGTRGLVQLSDKKIKMKPEEKKRILSAWDWLKQNHPLIKQVDVDEPSDLMNASEKVVEREPELNERRDVNESGFRACHMGPVGTGGPRTADESNNLDNMAIGILGRDQHIVKYSNPCLLGYLFPTLYPEGQGFFSLDYAGINGSQNEKVKYHNDNLVDDHFMDRNENDEEDVEGYISWSDSDDEGDDEGDKSEDEIEIDVGGGDVSKYSKQTIKGYAKFRLLSIDRRWGQNIKFILMMFDWIQKSAIFSYQMRIAPATTAGRATRAFDVLQRSNNGQKTKYRESQTVAIPPFIRTGAKYKSLLYQKFSALFEEFGTPQLFGTFTCDDRSDGQVGLAKHFGGPKAKTHKDPVLFTMHWKRQWNRFWNWVVTSRKGRTGWAERRVGGALAWCWVFELQDRGTPHTHFCIWTRNSIEQMIDKGIISCSKSQKNEEDRALVLKHQIHKCTAYCMPESSEYCRFNYPKPPSSCHTYFDEEEGRYVMQRAVGDERVNGYNMELLRFGRVNMDLQYNQGDKAKNYMCKYVTKQANAKVATIVQEADAGTSRVKPSEDYIQHFHYRSVGIVEAIMDICGWKMHGCSHNDVFLPTDLPSKRKRLLKRAAELKASPDSTDIFLDDKWTKYLKRPEGEKFENLTFPCFFKKYRYGKAKKKEFYVDGGGRYVTERDLGKEALVRNRDVNITNSEDAFMHLLMLHRPWRKDVDTWIGPGTEHETYQSLALEILGREEIERLADGLLDVLDHPDAYNRLMNQDNSDQPEDFEWTADQKKVLDAVKGSLQVLEGFRMLVTGAAGTGKSAVLKKISMIAKDNRFKPILLAPSGVAAVNIKGQTLHRWFHITKMGQGFPNCNPNKIREQLMDTWDEGLRPFFLIDEASMISGTMLTALSKALQEAAYDDHGIAFGGFPVVMFGDFGQLGPINKALDTTDWLWKSDDYRSFQRMDLLQACRQSTDPGFKSMLDDVRRGELTISMASVFLDICCASKTVPDDAVHLLSYKREVAEINLRKLRDLPGEEWVSIARDNAGITKDPAKREALEKETGLMTVLRLKIGARVMCTSNVDVAGGLVNGTTGVVTNIYGKDVVQISTDEGRRIFNIQPEIRMTRNNGQERRQIPLVLAWAMTIHKCQSLTLHKVVVYLRNVFASGQAYVALSRVRTRGDLFIKNWSFNGLLKVKHAIQTRLTKESEDARNTIDDQIDELEEKKEDESRIVVDVLDQRREIGSIESWEKIRNVRMQVDSRQGDSDSGGSSSNQSWSSDGDLSDASSRSEHDLNSSYESDMESDMESVSRVHQEYEALSASECSEDVESAITPNSDNEALSDHGPSDIVETQQEESLLAKKLPKAGANIIRSEKRKHHGSGSDTSESDESICHLGPCVAPIRQAAKEKSILDRTTSSHRAKKRVCIEPSDDVYNSGGERGCDYGTTSVKRKAWDDIESLRATKKMHMQVDNETSDEEDT